MLADAAHQSAVDAHHRPGDVGRPFTAQERRDVRVLLGSAVPAKRHRGRTVAHDVLDRPVFPVRLAFVEETRSARCDPARNDDVGCHPVTAHLVGKGFGPCMKARAQRVGDAEVRDGGQRTRRRGGQDAPPAPFLHPWQDAVGDRDDRQHHRLEAGAPRPGVLPGDRRRRRPTGVVDQDVDRAKRAFDLRDVGLDHVELTQVPDERHRLGACRLDLGHGGGERVGGPSCGRDVHTLLGEPHGDRAAKPTTRTENQRGTSSNTEIHCRTAPLV